MCATDGKLEQPTVAGPSGGGDRGRGQNIRESFVAKSARKPALEHRSWLARPRPQTLSLSYRTSTDCSVRVQREQEMSEIGRGRYQDGDIIVAAGD